MIDAGGLSAHGPASKDLTIVFDSVARIGSLTDPVAIGTDFAVVTVIDPNMMQDIGISFDQFGFDLMEDVIRSNQGTGVFLLLANIITQNVTDKIVWLGEFVIHHHGIRRGRRYRKDR